jgi:hypothetical protein
MVNPPNDTHPNAMKHSLIAQEILKSVAPELEAGGWLVTDKLPAAVEAMRMENETRAGKREAEDRVIVVPPAQELLD